MLQILFIRLNIILMLLTALNAARSTLKPPPELTTQNITSNIKEWDSDLAVMFYSPTCQYCKQLSPSWEHISALVTSKSTDVIVGKYNCEATTGKWCLC